MATREDVRFVHMRPVELKGRSTVVKPYRPVASSELLEKPTLTAKARYCVRYESLHQLPVNRVTTLANDVSLVRVLTTGTHRFLRIIRASTQGHGCMRTLDATRAIVRCTRGCGRPWLWENSATDAGQGSV